MGKRNKQGIIWVMIAAMVLVGTTNAIAQIGSYTTIINNATCLGKADGKAFVTANSGATPYHYLWSNNNSTDTISNVSAGTYYVTITDNTNNAIHIDSVVISDNGPLTPNYGNTFTGCYGVCNVSYGIGATNAASPFTSYWSTIPQQTTATVNNLCPGFYQDTIIDANGCKAIGSATIPQSVPFNIIVSYTNHGGCNDTARAVAPGGGTIFYYWFKNGVQVSQSTFITGVCAGDRDSLYAVQLTGGSCTFSWAGTAGANSLTTSINVLANPKCSNSCDGKLFAVPNGITGNSTYAWSNNATTDTITGLCAATYTVTVTNNGHTATATYILRAPFPLKDTIMVLHNETCNNFVSRNGRAYINVWGGTPPYNYTWSGTSNRTTALVSNIGAGLYHITTTDQNGCSVTDTITVTQPTPLTVTVGVDQIIHCHGDSNGVATAHAVGGLLPYSFAWSTNPPQYSATATGLKAGTYFVTTTSSHGCQSVDSVVLTETPTMFASVVHTHHWNCSDTAFATVSGGLPPYTYQWRSHAGATRSYLPNVCINQHDTLLVTDALGCVLTIFTSQLNPDVGNVCYSFDDFSLPAGNDREHAFAVFGNGNNGFLNHWYVTNGTPSVYQSNQMGNIAAYDGNQFALLGICSTADYSEGMTLSYQFNQGQSYKVSMAIKNAPYPTQAAQGIDVRLILLGDTIGYPYNVNTGCSTTPPIPAGSLVVDSIMNLPGNNTWQVISFTISNLTKNYTQLWFRGNLSIVNNTNTAILGIDSFCINPIGVPVGATTHTAFLPACHGDCSGKAYVIPSGTGPYTFHWNNGQVTDTAYNLCAGTYKVTVTGIGTAVDSITITEPAALSSHITSTNHGGCNDTLTVVTTGGTPPYSYFWSNHTFNSTYTGACAGQYQVYVSDNAQCQVGDSFTLTPPGAISAHITYASNITCNGLCNGKLYVNATGGSGHYTYAWSNGQTVPDSITNLCVGMYHVTVSDGNTSMEDSALITQPTAITSHPTFIKAPTCYGSSDGIASDTAFGGTPPYNFQWNLTPIYSASGTSIYYDQLTAGTYTITITDGMGCTKIDNVTVTQPSPLIDSIFLINNTSAIGTCDGSAYTSASGGIPPYTYVWNTTPATTNDTATGLCAGFYSITITDNNGCTAYAQKQITSPNQPLVANLTSVYPIVCHGLCSGVVMVNPTGGTTNYTYHWSNNDTTNHLVNICAGTYKVTISDGNTTITDSTTIIEAPSLQITLTIINDSSCSSAHSGSLAATVTGGTPNYTYHWNNSAATDTITGLYTARYTVLATDALGCTISATDSILNVANCDVWPGDANTDGVADNNDVLAIAQGYGDTGPVRTGASLTWVAQPATDWANNIPAGANEKHADCDGSGIINADDTLAVTQNYGLTHLKMDNQGSSTNPPIYIHFPPHDSVQAGQLVQVPVYLGDSSNPVSSIYGIAFSLNYDTTLVKDTIVSLNAGASWLGTPGVNLLTFRKDLHASSKTDIALARTDHTNTGGSGPICTVTYVMKDDISGKDEIRKALLMSISNVKAITYNGANVPLYIGGEDSIQVYQYTGIANTQPKTMEIKLYPNPAGQFIIADAGQLSISQYTITDMLGRNLVMLSGSIAPTTRINVSNLTPGMYFLQALSGKETIMLKFTITR